MAYATVADVQARITHAMTSDEQAICSALLDDAAVLIDSYSAAASASAAAKKTVSCRMVMRALSDFSGSDSVPMGATQGSMSGLGYSQSWTISSGASGELYLSKGDKRMLGVGNQIGAYSPVEELVPTDEEDDE